MNRLPILALAGMIGGLMACDAGRDGDMIDEDIPSVGREPVEGSAEELQDAQELANKARSTLQAMQMDSELWALAQEARGVFIIPDYGEAGAIVGGSGGEGVLFAETDGSASNPVFYDVGSVSVGAQLGAAGGEVAMLIMSDDALETFMDDDNFTLDAEAGLTIVDYSARAEASTGAEDVILWSDTEGAFAGVTLAITDIRFDDEENRAYYMRDVTPEEILRGTISRPDTVAR